MPWIHKQPGRWKVRKRGRSFKSYTQDRGKSSHFSNVVKNERIHAGTARRLVIRTPICLQGWEGQKKDLLNICVCVRWWVMMMMCIVWACVSLTWQQYLGHFDVPEMALFGLQPASHVRGLCVDGHVVLLLGSEHRPFMPIDSRIPARATTTATVRKRGRLTQTGTLESRRVSSATLDTTDFLSDPMASNIQAGTSGTNPILTLLANEPHVYKITWTNIWWMNWMLHLIEIQQCIVRPISRQQRDANTFRSLTTLWWLKLKLPDKYFIKYIHANKNPFWTWYRRYWCLKINLHVTVLHTTIITFDPPSAGEGRPGFHHPHAHFALLVGVSQGHVEWPSEDKFNLVAVHDARPFWPGVGGGAVLEVVQVCIPAGEPVPARIVRGARCRRYFSGQALSKCEHCQSFLLSISVFAFSVFISAIPEMGNLFWPWSVVNESGSLIIGPSVI